MTRRLFLTLRSPYARKVAIALREKGLDHAPVVVDLANRSPEFVGLGPLNKVPVLMDVDGLVVADSTTIVEYLEDRYPEIPLRGEGWEGRLAARRLDDLGDGLADHAVAAFFAAQRGEAALAARSLASAERILDALSSEVAAGGELVAPDYGPALGIGQIAVLSALGYLEFRHGAGWRDRHGALAAWADAQNARPSVAATAPRG